MKNIIETVDLYFDFIRNNEEPRTREDFEACLADAVLNYWRMLIFVVEDGLGDAAKGEESLVASIENEFTVAEKSALQNAAQRQLKERFGELNIDPEDESQNREQRFLTFIAMGRADEMYLL